MRENEFIIQTFEFEGAPDMVNIEYMWFEDLGDGRSRLRGRSICPNTEARDGLLSSGMEGGMTEGYEKLDVLLKSLILASPNDFGTSKPGGQGSRRACLCGLSYLKTPRRLCPSRHRACVPSATRRGRRRWPRR